MPPNINSNRAEYTNNTNQQPDANRPRNTEPGLFLRVVAILFQGFSNDVAQCPLSGDARRIGQVYVRPDDFYRLFAYGTPLPPPECWRIPGSLACELRSLDVSNQQLKMLPDHLPPNLRILNASQNELQALPNYLPPHLEHLDVSQNKLQTLPNNLPQNLEYLAIWCNQLQALPNPLPQNLTTLEVASNLLQTLPNPLPQNLTTMDVGGNLLQTLPNPLPSNLLSLKVSNNRLYTLPNPLPPGLTSLHARNNQLQTLPNPLPPRLNYLFVDNNQLQTLPNQLPDNLRILSATGNHLREVEEDLLAQFNRLNEANIKLNPLSEQTVERLRAREATRNGNGPRINFEPLRAVNIQPAPPAVSDAEVELAIARIRLRAEQIGLLNPQEPAQSFDPFEVESIMTDFYAFPIEGVRSIELGIRTMEIFEELWPIWQLVEGPDGQLHHPALAERPQPPAAQVPAEFAADPALQAMDLFRRSDALIANAALLTQQQQQQHPNVHAELGQAVIPWVTPPDKFNIAVTSRLWKGFADEPGAKSFAQFLERLGQTVNSTNPQFRAKVAKWLTHLEKRPNLRQATFSVSAGASDTCEDRVSLSFNTMQALRLAFDVAQGDYDNRLPKLIKLARGMFRLDELARIAAKTTQALQKTLAPTEEYVEEIEVYLAYQVKLREPLALPIDTHYMRYSVATQLRQADLDKAEQQVKQAEHDNFANYLSSEWQPWQEVLQRLEPQKHAQAQEALIEAMGDEFTQRLQTRLQAIGLTNDPDAERALGAQVRAEISREVYGQLTRDFLASKGMLNLLH